MRREALCRGASVNNLSPVANRECLTLAVRKILPLLLFFLLCSGLKAQRIHYDLRGCTLSVEDKARFQTVAEYETEFFAEVFGPQRTLTIRVRMYGDENKFLSGQRRLVGKVISETGFYAPVPKLVVVYKWPRYVQTTYHEMSHAIFHHHARWRPTWVDEGIAEYFKMATIDSTDNITIGHHIFRLQEMRKFVADSSSFSILPAIKSSHRKFHNRKETSHYSMSWGIVYYLRTFHDDIFRIMLYKMGTGRSSEKTIEEEYPGGIKQLERDMIRYYINTK